MDFVTLSTMQEQVQAYCANPGLPCGHGEGRGGHSMTCIDSRVSTMLVCSPCENHVMLALCV